MKPLKEGFLEKFHNHEKVIALATRIRAQTRHYMSKDEDAVEVYYDALTDALNDPRFAAVAETLETLASDGSADADAYTAALADVLVALTLDDVRVDDFAEVFGQ